MNRSVLSTRPPQNNLVPGTTSFALFLKLHEGITFDPVGRCNHVTQMHEKTLLIQLNFSSNPCAGSNVFFRPVVIFLERNLAGSKAFSHASAPRDYMSLPTLTGSKVIPPCRSFLALGRSVPKIIKIVHARSSNTLERPGTGPFWFKVAPFCGGLFPTLIFNKTKDDLF